jgi:hypothetical protein
MIVSVEAIFLSTFVMIGQIPADEKRQILARPGVGSGQTRGSAERRAPTRDTRA